MMTSQWWLGLLERSAKTFMQGFIAALAVGPGGVNLLATNWQAALVVALTASLLSMLTTLAGIQVPVVNRPVIYTPRDPGPVTQPFPQVRNDTEH